MWYKHAPERAHTHIHTHMQESGILFQDEDPPSEEKQNLELFWQRRSLFAVPPQLWLNPGPHALPLSPLSLASPFPVSLPLPPLAPSLCLTPSLLSLPYLCLSLCLHVSTYSVLSSALRVCQLMTG